MKTDRQLKQEVEAELEWDPAVNAAGIGVEVNDRVVTLAGHLDSYAEKLAAEKAAQRVGEVKAVVVELDVRLPHSDKRTDTDIANAADSILRWTVGLPHGAVKVQVEKGVVTLSGDVDWGYQSHVAERTISRMRGVLLVLNQIVVHGNAASQDVGEKIQRALQRHAEREAKHIDVAVRDGTVTLRGTVGSFAEKAVARGAAWSAPGVHVVVDELTVQ
jgi:hyperosmotically inducible protein